MNILFLDRLGEGYVGAPHTFHEFICKVCEKANCTRAGEGSPQYREGESVDDAVKRVMPDADWVIVDRDVLPRVLKPKNRRYKVGVFLSDLHGKWGHKIHNPVEFRDYLNTLNYDAFFLKYLEVHGCGVNPHIMEEGLNGDVYHLPWSVDVSKHTWRPKKVDVVFLGAIMKPYPLRRDIFENLYKVTEGYNVVCGVSPRGRTYDRHISKYENAYVGDRYVQLLNEAKIMIFGCSKYRYPVQKYFESAASACLTLADEPSTAKQLGLIDNETYVDINQYDWEATLLYCLENYDNLKRIIRSSLKNTLMNHSHEQRVKEWLKMLET